MTGTFLAFFAYAQQKFKYGDIPDEDLLMTTYAPDSSANAVVLFDVGRLNGNNFEFTRHVRIKVLKSGGTSWGNWTVNAIKGTIDAAVYNVQESGNIITHKLQNKDIFKEEYSPRRFRSKFFLSEVKVGSVIEVKYKVYGIPSEWRFQNIIPTRYNELYLGSTNGFDYTKRAFGFEKIVSVGHEHWLMENVPAFKEEPHLNHYSNYLSKLEFEITDFPSTLIDIDMASDWGKVSKFLQERYLPFGRILSTAAFLQPKAKELKAMDVDTLTKINLAYKYIQDILPWDGVNSFMASNEYINNYKNRVAVNSAEKNLMLVALLRRMGLDAVPVILSTRDHGLLVPFSASLDKLNYTVGLVAVGNRYMVLDATDKNLRAGIVPMKCLNGKGYALLKEEGFWVDLLQGNKIKRQSFTVIQKNDAGEWVADVNVRRFAYDYLDWAEKKDKSADDKEFRKSLQKELSGLTIEDYQVSNLQPDKLVVAEKYSLLLDENIDDLDYEVFINPFILKDIEENPFKNAERKYPIDLAAPREFVSTIQIKIPEGFQLSELPESANIQLADRDGSAVILFNQVGNMVQIQSSIKINRVIYSEGEYQLIKDFYSAIIKKTTEAIALQKTT